MVLVSVMYEINWYRPGPRHLRSQHHSYRPSPATSPSQGFSSYFHPCKMLNINNRAGVTVKMESQDCVLQWAMVQMWTTLINVKWLNIDINQKIMMCSDFIVLVFKQQRTKSVLLGKKKHIYWGYVSQMTPNENRWDLISLFCHCCQSKC